MKQPKNTTCEVNVQPARTRNCKACINNDICKYKETLPVLFDALYKEAESMMKPDELQLLSIGCNRFSPSGSYFQREGCGCV